MMKIVAAALAEIFFLLKTVACRKQLCDDDKKIKK